MISALPRLVVVDDDVALRTVFAKVLTRAGYEVRTATGHPDVVALVDEQSPAAVLMDNHMPGTSGIDLITLLRERWSQDCLPILLISGSSNQAEIDTAMRAGANQFRRKPVELADLLSAVQDLLAPLSAPAPEASP